MRLAVFSWRDLGHPRAGGSEVYVDHLARWWAAWGHDVVLFSSAVDGLPARDERSGYHIVRGGGRFGVYRAARRYYHECLRGQVDAVVDVVNTRPFLTPRYVREPVFALIHQVADDVWPYEVPPVLAAFGRHVLEPRWLASYTDTPVLTISPSSRASLAGYGLHDAVIVPVGVDPPAVPCFAKALHPTLVFVGRLAANKRPGDAIEAFGQFRARHGDARMSVVGEGPLRARLERTAPAGVTFHGRVSHRAKQELMGEAHALLATSVREGWGLTVSEAALVGTRAIAYDVAGLRDSVRAAGGILVPPGPAELAGAIERHLPGWQAEGRAELGDAGVVRWETVAEVVLGTIIAGTQHRALDPTTP